ncbi:hypothetical protein PFICI_12213 [Pestalotiopsis fici W106-1]|uniref:Anucleate primary sterigmata protein B n=1 Tax=Pestalotiopsis fici (strain W106-1 / CGMCC3.15140) TaxID=1229662 RepID=W3WNC1_PESFW|nr:uncharacterized protein PFICI_12213 [Pestalotiopsis fici W106-1]ETS75269.1 hypothetical protein PFICI_12213 [Pestalotiopsis fici W106-1]
MDEDESRAGARSQSPALKVDSPPEDDSYNVGDSSDAHADSMTEEQRLRAHLLQDVESSFVPPISPVRVAGPEGGVDDTFMFDASASSKKAPSPLRESRHGDYNGGVDHGAELPVEGGRAGRGEAPTTEAENPHEVRSTTPATATASEPDEERDDEHDSYNGNSHDDSHLDRHTTHDDSELPAQNISSATPSSPLLDAEHAELHGDHSFDHTEPGNTTSSLETLSSSPTAAAAARTISRAISMASQHTASGEEYSTSDAEHSISRDSSRLRLPWADHSFSAGASSRGDHTAELDPQKLSVDAGSTPGAALRSGNRPKYLHSRHASQRSSVSSYSAEEDGSSDNTVGLGADFAIQSGGAVPAGGMQRSLSNVLSRSVSMGSWASGLDDLPDSTRTLEPLEPLEEIDGFPERAGKLNGSEDNLATPKATKSNTLLPPTDTVIAKHVQNVEVPESLAIEYKTKNGLETPIKSFRKTMVDFTPVPGTAAKNGRSMTLKEQSSTIERLSKENFDLKLKVMFLSDRLDKLSEEGVKEMVSENVTLKTQLAKLQRDNKGLRRANKELEQRLRDEVDTRPSTAKSGYSSDGQTESPIDDDEREEELLYLRERVEQQITEIERLRSENMTNQADKRRLAETVKAMGDQAGERMGNSLGREEEADVFKDLLEQETARREQTDEDNRRLNEEIFRLKQELNMAHGAPAGSLSSGAGGMHHTTNIYNITRKAKPTSPTRSRPMSGLSGDMDLGSMSQSSTLVEDLRRESEQLRHENAELRREVGAQTSMLTSRNREKERLYQEIEDLKLAQRRNGHAPSTIDTLLDRSASRAGGHERSQSRISARTRLTMAAEDPGREEFENKLAEHRDKINELRLQNQELQRELETCMEDFEIAVEGKKEAETTAMSLQDELDNAMNDLIAIQNERDEALQEASEIETKFNDLRQEAQEEILALESFVDQQTEDMQRLELELQESTDNFSALQEEMHKLSEAFMRLEDDQEQKYRRIEELEAEVADSNKEFEELEAKLVESNDKANRLGVQQESSQGEIAFLREEQEADKIRIGDLEAAVANAEQSLREERDRAKELDQRLANERRQREIIATREKEEVQRFVNEQNKDLASAKDEARRLRKNLTSREVEAAEWKERLMELENNLREALGDLNGTRSSLLKSIAKVQKDLETTVRELDTTKASVLEKDRIIKQRDALLESHGLEGKKLAELLDKERQAHRNTKNSYETFQRTHQHVSRTVTNQDTRIVELESTRASDKKRLAQLENNFKDQLTERNNLLLVLWTKLSAVCGTDWAHDHSLINGRALPSLEAVATMLPGFSKNLLAAIKHIESVIGGFQTRIKGVEKELWKEYQALDNSLDLRSKKLDRLESIVRNGVVAGDFSATARISQLEAAIRALKIENATLMRANDAKTRAVGGYFDWRGDGDGKGDVDEYGSPSPHIPTGPIKKKPGDAEIDGQRKSSLTTKSKASHLEATSSSKTRTNTMSRSSSTNAHAPAEYEATNSTSGGGDGDTKWMFRLRELEYKLKQEREARNMDRSAAKQRILEGERQKDELVAELVRAKRRGGE